MKIAVIGGTGTIGRHVVRALQGVGVQPGVVARSRGVDVVAGTGLAEALAGVDTVIDVNNITTIRRSRAVSHFRASGRRIAEAERRAGVSHHLCLSIVGCDQVDFGYYGGKLVHESAAITSGIPWTILRATQFFEFARQILTLARGPILPVPRAHIQPAAAVEVADELVRLALAGPAAMVPELAGPEVMQLSDLIRGVLRGQGDTRRVVDFTLPGATGAALVGGALLPARSGPRATTDFKAWLRGAEART